MVLSGSKRTTYKSSIVNKNSGGGPKKAGLPFQIGREASVSIAYKNTSQKLAFLQGPKAMLKQKLRIAKYYLDKAVAIKNAADAVVTAKIATADALSNVTVASTDDDTAIGNMITTLNVAGLKTTSDDDATIVSNAGEAATQTQIDAAATSLAAYNAAKTAADALQAIIDARAPAGTAATNVTAEQGKVTTAQSNLDAYTEDV